MKITKKIPDAVVMAASSMLLPFVPEMTPAGLLRAVAEYGDSTIKREPDGLVSTAQACKLLNVSYVTLWRMAREGCLKRVKVGPRLSRFRMSDIRDAMINGVAPYSSATFRTAEQQEAAR